MRCCIQNEETHNSSNSRNSNSGRNRSYGFNRTALFVVVTAELLRTDTPWERKFGYLCRQERPYVPSTLLVSGCELSYLPRRIQIVFNLVHVNDQLTAVKIGYLLTRVTWEYRGRRCTADCWYVFFFNSPLISYVIINDRRLRKLNFRKAFLKSSAESFALALG